MKNIYFCIFFLILLSCSKNKEKLYSKESSSDSIAFLLKLSENDSLPVKNRIIYSDKSLLLIKNQKVDSLKKSYLVRLISNYSNMNEWNKYKISNKLFFESAIKDRDTLQIAKAYSNSGLYYFNLNVNDSAFYFYLKSEKLLKKINNKDILLEVFIQKAIIQFYNNDYLGAELSATSALKIAKAINNTQKEYYALNLLGVISNEFTNYKKAIEYHEKALKVVQKNKFPLEDHLETYSLNNIGYTYQNLGENEKAIVYFKKALNDKKLYADNPGLYATLIDNLAYSNFRLNRLEQLPSMFYKSLKIRDSLKLTPKIIFSKVHLSEYYFKVKNKEYSRKIALDALKNARTIGYSGEILLTLKHLSVVDSVNSGKYSGEYIKINDSLQAAERNSKEKFARIAFETDEIIQENVDLEGRNRTLLYFLMFGGIIILFVFIIRYQRNRAKELLYLQSQQRANEEIFNLMASQETAAEETRNKEKKKIAKDIHDGVLGRMFGARMNLDSLNNNTDPESVEKRLAYLNELKIIEQDLREISHDLNREKQVLINNFVAIVNDLLEEQRNAFPSKVTFKISEDINWNNINNNIKINMYRILQEGLQNINKYANAKKIEVSISSEANNIILSIIDNGDGFDANKKKKGIGLQNMISRANDCRGTIDINSIKGEGTTIILTMPITKPS